jgi:hypothetical protein
LAVRGFCDCGCSHDLFPRPAIYMKGQCSCLSSPDSHERGSNGHLPSTFSCNDKRQRSRELTYLSAQIGDYLRASLAYEAQDLSTIRSEEQVQRNVPECEHTVKLPCCVDVGMTEDFQCDRGSERCRELLERGGSQEDRTGFGLMATASPVTPTKRSMKPMFAL